MNTPAAFQHLFELPAKERMQLAEALWDSVAGEVEAADQPLPDWQRDELERRAALLDAGEMRTVAWEDIKKKWRDPSA
jgi:putative addiction module component (TIGR02574 family)